MGKTGLTRIEGPIDVQFIWFAPDARHRDADSLAVHAKACIDALVKYKVIDDDDSKTVLTTKLGPIVIARDNPRIEMRIRSA